MNVEAEIRDLKRRVSEIEGSFGFLTEQVKGVHKAVLAFQARTEKNFEKVERKFEKVDQRFDQVDSRLDLLDRGLRGLRTDMPKIVGDTLRDVLRDERDKQQK